MKFRGEDYYHAGLERMRQARLLHEESEQYALAMYCAGLAVECLLRAFRWEEDRSFSGRHDLDELLKASRLLRIDEVSMRLGGESEGEILDSGRRLRAAMQEVVDLWNNNLRYASEKKLAESLRETGTPRKHKGKMAKVKSRALLEAAQTIINRGVILWESPRGSRRP